MNDDDLELLAACSDRDRMLGDTRAGTTMSQAQVDRRGLLRVAGNMADELAEKDLVIADLLRRMSAGELPDPALVVGPDAPAAAPQYLGKHARDRLERYEAAARTRPPAEAEASVIGPDGLRYLLRLDDIAELLGQSLERDLEEP